MKQNYNNKKANKKKWKEKTNIIIIILEWEIYRKWERKKERQRATGGEEERGREWERRARSLIQLPGYTQYKTCYIITLGQEHMQKDITEWDTELYTHLKYQVNMNKLLCTGRTIFATEVIAFYVWWVFGQHFTL